MSSLKIPKDDLAKLKAIAELQDEVFDSLIEAIASARPTLRIKQFAVQLLEKVNVPGGLQSVVSLLGVICTLYVLVERRGSSSQELAEQVSRSAREANSEKFTFPEELEKILASRIKALLGFEGTLGITAKALDVMTENEHTFCGARILSDIRTIFTSSSKEPSAGVIIHNLQIGYHDSAEGGHKEIYIALDTDDIGTLKEIFCRAEKKTVALQEVLKRSGATYLEV